MEGQILSDEVIGSSADLTSNLESIIFFHALVFVKLFLTC